MGGVRAYDFDAVIGVGGIGPEPMSHGLEDKVNWIGIGPHKSDLRDGRGPLVTFDHFVLYESAGPRFSDLAPRLARRLYERNVRVVLHDLDSFELAEVARILARARHATASSAGHTNRTTIHRKAGKCHCHGCKSRAKGKLIKRC